MGNSVVASGGGGTPPTCSNCSTTHPLVDPTIAVGKSSNPASGDSVTAGQTLTYTLTAEVTGSALTSDLVLTDTLGGGQTFGSVTSAGDFTADTSAAPVLSFTLPSGTVPGTYTVSYTTTVNDDASGSVGNSVVASGGGDTPPTCSNCSTTHPLTDSGIVVSKTANPVSGSAVSVGQTVTFNLTAVVADAALTSDLVLTDTLGMGLDFDSVTNPGSFTADSSAQPVLEFTLPAGTVPGTYVVEYTATVAQGAGNNSGHTVGNTVIISGDGGTPDPECNSCATTHDVAADLVVIKTVDDQAPVAGGQVTFTIQVTNHGPSNATGVVVNDPLPSGYTWVSDSADTGSYNHGTGIWTVGDLANGASASLNVTVTVNGSGDYANTAVATANEPDPDPDNNEDTVTLLPGANADLVVVKTAAASVDPGHDVTWTVVVTNNGPSAADGAQFSDSIPGAVNNISALCGVETGGAVCGPVTVNGQLVSSVINSLPAGASVTFVIVGRAPMTNTEFTNTASVEPPAGVPDPNLGNNSDSAHTRVNIPGGNAISVPVDSRWMLLAMMLLLAGVGVRRQRQRRPL